MSATGRHGIRATEKRGMREVSGHQEPSPPPRTNRNNNNNNNYNHRRHTATTTKSSFYHRYARDLKDPQSKLNGFLCTDKSLSSLGCYFNSLALEPHESRRERIVMFFEAFAVFGALFLNGIWFIWEYGNSQDFDNDIVKRLFDLFTSLSIVSGILLPLFAGTLWIIAIQFSGSHTNFAYGARHLLNMCIHMYMLLIFVILGALAIGIYNALKPNLPETIIVLSLLGSATFIFTLQINIFVAGDMPLEWFHYPIYFKAMFLIPFHRFYLKVASMIFPCVKELSDLMQPSNILEGAKERAETLKKQAHKEILLYGCVYDGVDDDGDSSSNGDDKNNNNNLRRLLCTAAENIGKVHLNVGPYLARLEDDLYDDTDSLMDEDVETLCNYMPRRLAREVYKLIHQKEEKNSNTKSKNETKEKKSGKKKVKNRTVENAAEGH